MQILKADRILRHVVKGSDGNFYVRRYFIDSKTVTWDAVRYPGGTISLEGYRESPVGPQREAALEAEFTESPEPQLTML